MAEAGRRAARAGRAAEGEEEDRAEEEGRRLLFCVQRAGDVLFVPQGWCVPRALPATSVPQAQPPQQPPPRPLRPPCPAPPSPRCRRRRRTAPPPPPLPPACGLPRVRPFVENSRTGSAEFAAEGQGTAVSHHRAKEFQQVIVVRGNRLATDCARFPRCLQGPRNAQPPGVDRGRKLLPGRGRGRCVVWDSNLTYHPSLFCMSWCPDFEFRGTIAGAGAGSNTPNSGHQLLLPPAKLCPIFAAWTTQATGRQRSSTPPGGYARCRPLQG